MRRRHFRIRRWLVLAVAVVALAVPATSQARPILDEGGATPQTAPPVTVTTGGFEWGDALIGAGIAAAVALSALAIVQAARHRRRLATLL